MIKFSVLRTLRSRHAWWAGYGGSASGRVAAGLSIEKASVPTFTTPAVGEEIHRRAVQARELRPPLRSILEIALVVIRMVEERVAALELELRLREPLPDVIHSNERPRRNVRTVDADGLGKEKVQRQLINALCA